MVELERLRRALDVDELVATAQELVRAPSPNPPGDEAEVAAIAARRLEQAGAREVTTVDAGGRRHSVVARWGAPGGRVLAWNGHLDVVPVADEAQWRHPPFSGAVADGRLWGRGAVDMKGPVAAALHALRIVQRAGLEPLGEVVFSLVADEECGGGRGAGHLLERQLLPPADAGICGEPTGLDVLTGARGRLWIELATFGRSAHASQPERGENAIAAMLKVAAAIADGDTPGTAATPTAIRGGEGPNTVPDRCSLTIDRRFSASEGAEAARAHIRDAVERVCAETGARIEMIEHACLDAAEIDPGAEIVHAVRDAAALVSGRAPGLGVMRAATDARFLIAAGIPTVVFGPGDLEQAHTVDESIAIADLADGALAYAAAICGFLGTR
jgi:acetylornithine deacetylase/succinyl-diaminopimelate desuccinylase family protein